MRLREIRGSDLELGRDPDTGGQTRYVVELARALAAEPAVERVDLVTLRWVDPSVHDDYAQPTEDLGRGAQIIRIDAGHDEYLPKEKLWDHLDPFVDNFLEYLREQERLPDILHSHYADAGYVGSRVSHILGIPLVHTGHSLGRVKRRRLLAAGLSAREIEERFNIRRRIAAEELTLASSSRVVASTQQEVEEQYGLYDFYQPGRMCVVPPGTDLSSFRPPDGTEKEHPVANKIGRFLQDPDKPMVLVLARPVPRKNLVAHVDAFGADPQLRKLANLVVIAGTRNEIADLDEPATEVLTELLLAIDRHDLYGHVAYPKDVSGEEIGVLYRLAAQSGGIHVNAALTEPFGLTLIESAASGLPIVATSDGGPRDIIGNCGNGVLVDPLDTDAIASGMTALLSDRDLRDTCAEAGLRGVREHYSWTAHAERYLELVDELIASEPPLAESGDAAPAVSYHDRALVTDIDLNLLAAPDALSGLGDALRVHRKEVAFVVATGRRLEDALRAVRAHGLPDPDVLIASGGTRIFYGPSFNEDEAWLRHIEKGWTPKIIRRVLDGVDGIERQPRRQQSRHKISYFIDPAIAPDRDEINGILFREELSANVIVSHGQFLDVYPLRASKGLATRYVMTQLDIPLERTLTAGGSGADEDLMRGNTLAVVVKNRHDEELSQLEDLDRIYFADGRGADGILEAAAHYGFFDPRSATESS